MQVMPGLPWCFGSSLSYIKRRVEAKKKCKKKKRKKYTAPKDLAEQYQKSINRNSEYLVNHVSIGDDKENIT
jgi:hypothetical protein